MRRFWNFESGGEAPDQAQGLRIDGEIASSQWWDDDVTPRAFREALMAHKGDLTVWINSPGGDVIAASQIYTMLREYGGDITVKVDGLAASAASVIAMAGNRILMSPTSYMMIHDPLTWIYGNSRDMEKAGEMLDEIKAGIVNAYQQKTGLARSEIEQMMQDETWMNAVTCADKGFADGILYADDRQVTQPELAATMRGTVFAAAGAHDGMIRHLEAMAKKMQPTKENPHQDRPRADESAEKMLRARLKLNRLLLR